MPFAYYNRLNRRQKAIYRASDERAELKIEDPKGARALTEDLRDALEGDASASAQRIAVQRTSTRLARELCDQLGVDPVKIKVLARRPRSAEAELHGLYTWEQGERAQITVWMRTAQRKQVVAFKTYLRTLLHELCHHFDYHLFELADSFHTEGFFRRESHLAKQLLRVRGTTGKATTKTRKPRATRARPARSSKPGRKKAGGKARSAKGSEQLVLPIFGRSPGSSRSD